MMFRMTRPIVYVLDDEVDMVDLVDVFLKDQNVELRKFTRPDDFLAEFDGTPPGVWLWIFKCQVSRAK